MSDAVVWHDVECGAYAADLPLWRELAAAADGPVLDLGAGTGRVALDLAAQGHEVVAVERDAELLAELGRRAGERGLEVSAVRADVCSMELGRSFALVLAPMQLMQIVGGAERRAAALERVRAHLRPEGAFAAALAVAEDARPARDAPPALPDVAERDGWVFSSLPLDVRAEPGQVAVERLRQRVSPDGELREERHTEVLESLDIGAFEREVAAHGLRPVERREIAATPDHVGSMVCICRR